jgi:hypothetical protein
MVQEQWSDPASNTRAVTDGDFLSSPGSDRPD